MEHNNQLQVIVASGPESVEKALVAMAFALAAAAAQTEVTVFFTMNGAAWLDVEKGNDKPVHGFESIGNYWQMLLDLGARLEGCHSCVDNYCRSCENTCTLREGYHLSGLSTAAMRATTVQTVTF
jgi:predicted peroxiredoxin